MASPVGRLVYSLSICRPDQHAGVRFVLFLDSPHLILSNAPEVFVFFLTIIRVDISITLIKSCYKEVFFL